MQLQQVAEDRHLRSVQERAPCRATNDPTPMIRAIVAVANVTLLLGGQPTGDSAGGERARIGHRIGPVEDPSLDSHGIGERDDGFDGPLRPDRREIIARERDRRVVSPGARHERRTQGA